MQTERLESRQFLSAATAAASGGDFHPIAVPIVVKLSHTGTLFIAGSTGRDTISVTSTGGSDFVNGKIDIRGQVVVKITVKRPGEALTVGTASFDQAQVKRIDISGGAGDDFIDVNTGITGRTVLHGGKGDDRLQTTGNHNSLFGDGGDDVLTSNTSTFFVESGSGGHIDTTTPRQRGVQLSYNLLDGGDGADTFRSRGGDDSIVGGSGADRFEPLEAGIVITNGLTLPTVTYPPGATSADSRLALSDVGVTAVEPDQEDVKVFLNAVEPLYISVPI